MSDQLARVRATLITCPGRSQERKHRWRTTYFAFDPPFRQCKRCGQRQRLRLANPPDNYWFWLDLPDPAAPAALEAKP